MGYLLELQELTVAVAGHTLLQGVNLRIPQGEIHALLGPNGCGKTTLMMAIMGYPQYRVTGGAILFDGVDVTAWDITGRARAGISMAHQRPPTMPGVTLRNVLDYVLAGAPPGTLGSDDFAAAADTDAFLDRSINAGLSGGEIKRSELVQMLAMRPRLALLDEPDSGIDLESLALVGEMVRTVVAPGRAKRAGTALLVTHTGHILDMVAADRAHVMMDGRIVCSGDAARLIETIRRDGFHACATAVGRLERNGAEDGNGLAPRV